MKRRNRAQRLLRLTAVYLLLLPFLLLGWLYSRLPDRVYLEPGQALLLPRFGWVEPMGLHGSQNAASTQVVGSYQTTLSLGGWLPIKNIRTVVTERTQVTVCGTPFGVKMFSEGALIVGFSDIDSPGGSTVNPAKAAGLRLGDRVIRIGQIRTENNDAVKEALEAARGSAAEVIYVRSGEQRSTTLTPVWDAAAELTKLVKMELREIEKLGLYAILYTYSNFADYNLNMWQLNGFDLWLADYRNKRPTRKHGMWQYSSKGKVAGVSGVVDMNHVYKDYPSIIAKAGLTSVKGA